MKEKASTKGCQKVLDLLLSSRPQGAWPAGQRCPANSLMCLHQRYVTVRGRCTSPAWRPRRRDFAVPLSHLSLTAVPPLQWLCIRPGVQMFLKAKKKKNKSKSKVTRAWGVAGRDATAADSSAAGPLQPSRHVVKTGGNGALALYRVIYNLEY